MIQSTRDFSSTKVLVVGDLMLDRYWHGESERISPEAPVPIVRVEGCEERAGAAANVALNVSALGAQVNLVGSVGDDEDAGKLLRVLSEGCVACDGVARVAGRRTVVKLRVMSRNQQLVRLDFEDPAPVSPATFAMSQVKKYVAQSDVVIVSDYGKGGTPDIGKLIAMARAANTPVLVDPKGTDYSVYQNATVLTPNAREFELAFGEPATDTDRIARAGLRQIDRLGLQSLLVTRGAQGMTLIQKGEKPFHLAADKLEVYDVTGAGDTVIATLAVAYGSGVALPEAVRLANIAAGISISRTGTVAVSSTELGARLQDRALSERGVVSSRKLPGLVQAARSAGERLVFTNGCFDILHVGHVSLLEQAARLGDRLIVAVNSDASVRRLKGVGRPINGHDERMRVLASLACVDWVVGFSEDTPERILRALRPDVLAKGGDYTKDQVVCSDLVESYGGEVCVLEKVENVSTTRTISRASLGK